MPVSDIVTSEPASDETVVAPHVALPSSSSYPTPPAPPHEDKDAQRVKGMALSGLKSMGLRTIVSLLLRIVGSLVLARYLFPKDYGVFGIAATLMTMGMWLAEAGLSAGLVRQKREPTRDEIFTVFVCQQILTLVIIAVLLAITPLLVKIYHLTPTSVALTRAMILGLTLYSLRVVPMMMLERDLRFTDVARCELIENVIRTVSVILLAIMGAGAWALAGSILLSSAIYLVCVWNTASWQPRGRFDRSIVLPLLRFGLPFQLNAILPALGGSAVPGLVGSVLGIGVLGYINWAAGIASVPMMLNAMLIRIAFPAYSRLQDKPEALAQYLNMSLRRLGVVLYAVVSLIIVACPVLIPPLFTNRWNPAIVLVQWACIEAVFQTMVGTIAAVQNATGYPSERLMVTVFAGILRWIITYLVVYHLPGAFSPLDALGVGLAVVSLVEVYATAYLVRRRTPECHQIVAELNRPLFASGIVLLGAVYLGGALAPDSIYLRGAVTLVSLIVLTLLRETLTPWRLIRPEIPGILSMLRTKHV